jgi:hypothetical protein
MFFEPLNYLRDWTSKSTSGQETRESIETFKHQMFMRSTPMQVRTRMYAYGRLKTNIQRLRLSLSILEQLQYIRVPPHFFDKVVFFSLSFLVLLILKT